MRATVVLLIALLGGCTWGRSKPENCTRFTTGEGIGRLEQLAAAQGLRQVEVEHDLCSNRRELLESFSRVGREEVGWCARITERLPATAPAMSASIGRWCDEAVRRQVRYANWSSVVGEQFLFVAEHRVIEHRLSPRPATSTP